MPADPKRDQAPIDVTTQATPESPPGSSTGGGSKAEVRAGRPWGPLLVLEPIGSGGFGDVFRAHDPALGRDVALKLLKPIRRFSAASDSIIREGQLLARVRHPNVMAVYGAREVDGQVGIWSELLTGRTLAQIVRSDGLLSAAEALVCAEPMTLALSAVHRAGLLHRDIKAQNVMRERGGRLVLMDFGVGRELSELHPHITEDPLKSPELIGTPVYLAPELFTGSPASVRSDIYSLGVLLFFLATGSFPVLGSGLKEIATHHRANKRQRLHDLRPDLPAAFVEIVERAIDPDPEKRFESCGAFHEAVTRPLLPQALATRSPFIRALRAAAPLALGGVLATAGLMTWRELTKTPQVFSIVPPPGTRLAESSRNVAAVSPDGQRVAFVATDNTGFSSLWLRSMWSGEATPVADSQGASSPFWSPDGSAIAFFSRTGLKRVTLTGVRSESLVATAEERGGTWSTSGEFLIARSPREGLYLLPASGGEPRLVIAPDRGRGEIGYMWPQFLPDGRQFIYFALSNDERVRGIYLASLDGGAGRRLIAADASGVIAGDYILFVRDGALAAQPFDTARGQTTGVVEQVLQNVATSPDFRSAVSATSSGVLVYSSSDTTDITELTWYDRWSQPQSKVAPPGKYKNPALSHDGRYLAVEHYKDSLSELRIFDSLTPGGFTRIASAATVANPIWSWDGRVAYATSHTGRLDIYATSPENPSATVPLVVSNSDKIPDDWSPDGKFVAYTELSAETKYDVWVKPVAPPGPPIPIATSDANEASAKFSPDGKTLAYLSAKTGVPEIYVRSFPDGSDRKVSMNGGYEPSWGQGRQVYYLDSAGRLMMVEVPVDPAARIGAPRPALLTTVITPGAARNHYVLHPNDAGAVLVNSPVNDARAVSLTVVNHWLGLRRQSDTSRR